MIQEQQTDAAVLFLQLRELLSQLEREAEEYESKSWYDISELPGLLYRLNGELERWPRSSERELAIDYVKQHTQHWPIAALSASPYFLGLLAWPLHRLFSCSMQEFQELSPPQRESLGLVRCLLMSCSWSATETECMDCVDSFLSVERLFLQGAARAALESFARCRSLQTLHLQQCQLNSLGELGGYPLLEELVLSRMGSLNDIRDCSALPALRRLALRDLPEVSFPPRPCLEQLEELVLHRCHPLTDLSFLEGATSLKKLSLCLVGDTPMPPFGPLAALDSLECLELFLGGKSLSLSPLYACEQLKSLEVYGIDSLEPLELDVFDEHPTLERLSLVGMGDRDLQALPELPALKSLRCCLRRIESLCGMKDYPELTLFDLRGCSHLIDFEELPDLPMLQELELEGCRGLDSLSGISGLPSLVSLDFGDEDSLSCLDGLGELPQLASLDLLWWSDLDSLVPLSELSSLKELVLSVDGDGESLETIPIPLPLEKLDLSAYSAKVLKIPGTMCALRELEINASEELTELVFPEGLRGLQVCSFLDEPCSISSLAFLREQRELQALSLGCCEALESFDGLPESAALTSIDVHHALQLTDISALSSIGSVDTLHISGSRVVDWHPIAHLPLKALTIDSSHSVFQEEEGPLFDAALLTGMEGLRSFHFKAREGRVGMFPSFEAFPHLPSLTDLTVANAGELEHLNGLESLPALRSVSLHSTTALRDFEGLCALSHLTSFDLRYVECDIPSLVGVLVRCSSLESLFLYRCGVESMSQLRPLLGLPHLRSLRFDLPNGMDLEFELPLRRDVSLHGKGHIAWSLSQVEGEDESEGRD